MLRFTENDLKDFLKDVIHKVAEELNVEHWEWKGASELLENIKSKNAPVYSKLEAFLSAYEKWHKFHVEIDRGEKAGKLDDGERKQLQALIHNKDSSRRELITSIRH